METKNLIISSINKGYAVRMMRCISSKTGEFIDLIVPLGSNEGLRHFVLQHAFLLSGRGGPLDPEIYNTTEFDYYFLFSCGVTGEIIDEGGKAKVGQNIKGEFIVVNSETKQILWQSLETDGMNQALNHYNKIL